MFRKYGRRAKEGNGIVGRSGIEDGEREIGIDEGKCECKVVDGVIEGWEWWVIG